MEHISKDLNNLQKHIPRPMNGEINNEEEKEIVKGSKEWVLQKLQTFNISTLEHTFDKFVIDKDTAEAVKLLKSLSDGNSKKQFILLFGGVGCGKTHLIEATIINWAEHGIKSYYMTFSDIARRLKAKLREGGEYYEEQFARYRDAKRLIIDDFGMGTTESRFEVSELEDIIDLRYRKRYYPDCDLVTIMATNKDIKEIPERVASRFADKEFGVILYMGDKDYRRRKNEKSME